MELTKRRVLQTAGVAASGLSGAELAIASESPDPGVEPDSTPARNFGLFNNSATTKRVQISVAVRGKDRLQRTFTVNGINDPATEAQANSWFKGNLIVPAKGQPKTTLRAVDEGGQAAETQLHMSQGGISPFSRSLVKITTDGDLTVLEVLR